MKHLPTNQKMFFGHENEERALYCSDAVFHHGHHREFESNKVCANPLPEEECTVDSNGCEERARNPSVQPVESLM